MRRRWTSDEDEYLRQNYPCRPTAELAVALGRTTRAVYDRAVDKFQLRKSPAFMAALKAEIGRRLAEVRISMRAKDFLAEFDPEQFPSSLGPAISVDAHDPPFSRSQLRQMERQNLIVMNKEDTHYRLTLKATKVAALVA